MSGPLGKTLAELRERLPPVPARRAVELVNDGALLVDIREADEIAQGTPVEAARYGRGFLEMRLDQNDIASERTILLMCASGARSLLAADELRRLGYTDTYSVDGGFDAWKQAGLPFETPATLDTADRARYARQITLPEIGEGGQAKLAAARVLIIGAGGLGSPVGFYLAAAGVGHIGIVDHDILERSNLHRQIVHRDAAVGESKARSARDTLAALNPSIHIEPIEQRVTPETAPELVAGYDLVVDGSDNFDARFAINDACVAADIPLIFGAVERFDGQVGLFPAGGQPCYRCLFPEMPPAEAAPSCADAGVLGAVPGVVGTLQAVEALKHLAGEPDTLAGRILALDTKRQHWRTITLPAGSNCDTCG
ncbi:molybdopterin-synthase adenylyltransferase MoeB [Salinisphaera sp. USBA-960]|nr:molybdopterin-synthase adenylyltransferase MoeB [Salifodinibacter halophilus]NNC26336.1 molybdopterin-synthase adenylyltransferase MoeB [Salifodinibacter halophilus]